MNKKGIENLCNGIVLQACKDYRSALAGKKVNGKPPEWVISECESFFFSHWFSVLTKLDPHYLVDKMRKEFGR